jgi:hypothetical protein
MRIRTLVWLAALAVVSVGLASCTGSVGGGGGGTPVDPGAPTAGAAGTAGPATGAAGTGSADPALPPPVLFEAVGPESYTAKVKNLLTGLPLTSAELAAVTADPKALRGLIDQWMALPQFQTKMLVFFRNAFQQAQVDNSTLLDQMGGRGLPSNGQTLQRLIVDLQESFARTAMQLVQTNKPFNGAIDTKSYMMTTALAVFLAFLDDRYVDDAGRATSRWAKANPMLTVTATSDLTIPMTDTMNPASPNYLKVSTGMAMPEPCLNPARSYTGQDAPVQLFSMLMGRVDTDKTITDGMSCKAFNMPPVLTDADFTDWHMVSMRAPKAGELTTKFYDVAALRGVKELVLNVPRVGFMTTPAFFANWSTNTSNLYRVTINQALIVALGKSFDGTGSTVPVSEVGLDMEHAAPGSACYACHATLDPMRQLFTQSFTLFYHEQTDATKIAQSGVFTFEGVSHVANGAGELATSLAAHPSFAKAWTQKLCFYADSAACSEGDPEFTRVADVFKTSNYNWKTLVRELFSSPLVTGAARTKTFDERGVPVSVARRDHLCATLEQRLGVPDPCGISGLPGLTGAQNSVAVLVRGLPSDGYTRGAETPILPSDTSLFFRSGTENICRRIADQMVDVAAAPTAVPPRLASKYQSTTPDAAIADFVQNLMGLPDGDPRAADAKLILNEHYQGALKVTGIKPREALKSTFVLACTAPSTISVGL